jgi:hypothetical protein
MACASTLQGFAHTKNAHFAEIQQSTFPQRNVQSVDNRVKGYRDRGLGELWRRLVRDVRDMLAPDDTDSAERIVRRLLHERPESEAALETIARDELAGDARAFVARFWPEWQQTLRIDDLFEQMRRYEEEGPATTFGEWWRRSGGSDSR